VFQIANTASGDIAYRITLVSESGGTVPTAAGFDVLTEPFADRLFDTIIAGAFAGPNIVSPRLTEMVGRSAVHARRVGSFCTGAFILAKAGLLAGRRATTHWRHAEELRARFPDLLVEPGRIFINDGKVWTSAGMSAGIDLALALVKSDIGSHRPTGIASFKTAPAA
jgi:transcriptional regulator GlxA family with amidase domain